LEDRRNVGENSCNSGDGTDQTGPILDVYDNDDDDDDIFNWNILVSGRKQWRICFSYRKQLPRSTANFSVSIGT